VAGLLDWSRVPSGDGMASESQSLKVFEGRVTEASDRVPESWFMILLKDTCRDPAGGQILTTTSMKINL